jgi:hypothetical protein
MCPVEVNKKMHKKRGNAWAKAESIRRNTEKTGENHVEMKTDRESAWCLLTKFSS